MFTCFAEASKDSDSEGTERRAPLQGPDLKGMDKGFKTLLKSCLRKLVHEDNSEALEEALEAEKSAHPKIISKKGKKKNVPSGNKEEEEFSILGRKALHYACALDSVECCKVLLTTQNFPRVSPDAVDETDKRSALHYASLNHSRRCIEVLLKQGANVSLKNKNMAVPLEEALLSNKLHVDWNFSTPASDIVEKVRGKDLTALQTLEPKCRDQLITVAFKLAKGLKLVPLVGLLIVARSSFVVNAVAKKADGEEDSVGTLVDLLLGKALSYSSVCSLEKPLTESKKGVSEAARASLNGEFIPFHRKSSGEGQSSILDSKVRKDSSDWTVGAKYRRDQADLDDSFSEVMHRKDSIEWEEINTKYRSEGESSAADSKTKKANSPGDSEKFSVSNLEQKSSVVGDDTETNCKIARKLLECVLLFTPRLSSHPQSPLLAPLLRVAQANDEGLMCLLLEAGALINETDSDGNTALHWALRQATPVNKRSVNSRLVKRLLDAGANVLMGNKLGATPVHTAAGHGHFEALSLILDKDAGGVNVMAGTKETPLHYSVKNNHLLCTALLLTHGANRNVSSLRSQKPYQLAPSAEMRALLSLDETTLRQQSWDSLLTFLSAVAQQQSLTTSSSSCQVLDDLSTIPCLSSQSAVLLTQTPHGFPSPSAAASLSFSQSLALSPSSMSLSHSQMLSKSLPQFQLPAGPRQQVSQDLSQAWNSPMWLALQHASQKQSVNGLDENDGGGGKSSVNLPAFKTVLCRFFGSSDGCGWGTKCHFAHSEEELRTGQQILRIFAERTESVFGLKGCTVAGDPSDQGVKNFKTKLCMHHEKLGSCPHGGKCKFAHGEVELRPLSASSSVASVARLGARPSTASSFASSGSEEGEDSNARKIFVGGLPHFINSDEMWEFFEAEFGKVVDAVVICGNDEEGKSRSRGFGFVLFEQQKDADEAVKRHYFPFRGKKVEVKRAMARMDSASGDEAGKFASSFSSGISSPAAPQSPAMPPSLPGVGLFNDGMQLPASPYIGVQQGWSLPSLSADMLQEGIQSISLYSHTIEQPLGQNSAHFVQDHSVQIQKTCSALSSQFTSSKVSSQETGQYYDHCHGNVHMNNSFLASAQRGPSDTNLSTLSKPHTESSSKNNYLLSRQSAAPSVQPNSSNGGASQPHHPFSYYYEPYSTSSHTTPPDALESNQISEDEELQELLALLQPPTTSSQSSMQAHSPSQSHSFQASLSSSRTRANPNRVVHQPLSLQNSGKEPLGAYSRDSYTSLSYKGSPGYTGGCYNGFSTLPSEGMRGLSQVSAIHEVGQNLTGIGYSSSQPGTLGVYNPQLPVGSKGLPDCQTTRNLHEPVTHTRVDGGVNSYPPNLMNIHTLNTILPGFNNLQQGHSDDLNQYGGFDLSR